MLLRTSVRVTAERVILVTKAWVRLFVVRVSHFCYANCQRIKIHHGCLFVWSSVSLGSISRTALGRDIDIAKVAT